MIVTRSFPVFSCSECPDSLLDVMDIGSCLVTVAGDRGVYKRARFLLWNESLIQHQTQKLQIHLNKSISKTKPNQTNFNKHPSTCLTKDARISLPVRDHFDPNHLGTFTNDCLQQRPRRRSLLTLPSPPSRRSRRLSPTPPTAFPAVSSPMTASRPLRKPSTSLSAPKTTTMEALPVLCEYPCRILHVHMGNIC
jgi:hypothetical protein